MPNSNNSTRTAGLRANPDLIAAHLPLTNFFGKDGASFDPWWWPMNSGGSLEDYGLDSRTHREYGSSLRIGPPDPRLSGCRGSIGALPGCAVIITTRPSSGSYPGNSGIMVQAVSNPNAANPGPNIHITDLVKFRGIGGDAAFDRGVDMGMWKASLDCLFAELEALEPSLILVSKGASSAIFSWLPRSARKSAFGRWHDQLSTQHRQLLGRLAICPVVPSLTPKYFGGPDEAERVRRKVIAEYHQHLSRHL